MSTDEKLASGPIGASKRFRVKSPRTLEHLKNWTEITDEEEIEKEETETSTKQNEEEEEEIKIKQPQQINKKEQENQELKSQINFLQKKFDNEKEKNEKQTKLINELREEILNLKKKITIEENTFIAHQDLSELTKQKYLNYKKNDILINVQKGIENDYYYGYIDGTDDVLGFFSVSDVKKSSKSIMDFKNEIENLVSLIIDLTEVNSKSSTSTFIENKSKSSILKQSRIRGSRPLSYRELPSNILEDFFEEEEDENSSSNTTSISSTSSLLQENDTILTSSIDNSSFSNLIEFDQKKIDSSIYKSLERKYSKIIGKSVTTNRSIRQQLIKEPSSEILDLLNPLFKVIKYNPDGN